MECVPGKELTRKKSILSLSPNLDTEEKWKEQTWQLRKLLDFSTYEEVKDVGQFQISTTRVMWGNGE